MRVALVHDWLVAHRGGEAVLLELARLFPGAPIYTLVADQNNIHPELAARQIHTSFLQDWPGAPKRFRQYLPFFPAAIEAFNFDAYDLVVSTSHCVAKGVKTGSAFHLSYIHTPMRYAWEHRRQYLPAGLFGQLARPTFEVAAAALRRWDLSSAGRPNCIVANSAYVRGRIAHSWGREAQVIYPPVDTEYYCPSPDVRRGDFYAVVGAQVGYKNNQLAVEYATEHGIELRVVGSGPAIEKMRRQAGPTVHFEGHISRDQIRQIYRQAKGLFFCGVEDFGIVPVEAISCGCPVIAYSEGGALETVIEGGTTPTGVFFGEPTMAGLEDAVERLEQRLRGDGFVPQDMHEVAQRFSRDTFRSRILDCLQQNGIQCPSV